MYSYFTTIEELPLTVVSVNFPVGELIYDRPTTLPENWRRSWEWSRVNLLPSPKFINLPPGDQSFDRPSLLVENWRRGWEWNRAIRLPPFIFRQLPPGEQFSDTPILLVENWRRGWEKSGPLLLKPGIVIIQLPVGDQFFDRPNVLREDWRRGLESLRSLYLPPNIALPPPGKSIFDLPAPTTRKDVTDFVNLLNTTLSPSPIIVVTQVPHFKPFHITMGRMGHLGGIN